MGMILMLTDLHWLMAKLNLMDYKMRWLTLMRWLMAKRYLKD